MNRGSILGAARETWTGALRVAVLAAVTTAAAGLTLGGEPGPEALPHGPGAASDPGVRVGMDRSDSLTTKDGLTLHLTTDLGSVRVVTLEPGAPPVVRYTVHLETDARGATAQSLLEHYTLVAKATGNGVEINGTLPPQLGRGGVNAQFFVQFEVTVPAGYSLDINTAVGDIETQDVGGTANLVTQGGNIRVGRIGTMSQRGGWPGHLQAKLSTEGGQILVGDVTGNLDAFTAGGDIVTANISGDAALRTGGGHIRVGQIGGRAQLETDGGNITVKQA